MARSLIYPDEDEDYSDIDPRPGRETHRMWCPECGWVQTIIIDNGIGFFEAAGVTGTDVQLCEVCPHCECSVDELFTEEQFLQHQEEEKHENEE